MVEIFGSSLDIKQVCYMDSKLISLINQNFTFCSIYFSYFMLMHEYLTGIESLSWYESMVVSASRDKMLRIFDVRGK